MNKILRPSQGAVLHIDLPLRKKFKYLKIFYEELSLCFLVQHLGGTGSSPPSFKGLQRRIRLNASQPPLKAPCSLIASTA